MSDRRQRIAQLRRTRPKSLLLRGSAAAAILFAGAAWIFGGFDPANTLSERRLTNLSRFLGEATPAPLRDDDPATGFWEWALELLKDPGLTAAATTFGIALAAIVLAAALAVPLILPAARNVATPEPFLPGGRPPSRVRRTLWRALNFCTRLLLVFLRAIPDYMWAFLFIALLGPHAWPAVLALALHNVGILGRLGAEVVENSGNAIPAALRGAGATRLQIATVGIGPVVLPRFLLYFFYRWETCVREATILGMLGFSSLGYWIIDARARNSYDTMLFFVILGAVLVLLGDVVSAIARGVVRRAS